jgi:hypothetical protein
MTRKICVGLMVIFQIKVGHLDLSHLSNYA